MRGLLPALLIAAAAAAVVLAQSDDELSRDPHAPINAEGSCGDCHTYWEGQLEPHMFSVMVDAKCWNPQCHPPVGRNHPVNVSPRESDLEIEVPENLPLAYIDEIGDDVVSCGTCHNPHGPWLGTVKAYPKETPHVVVRDGAGEQIAYYKTYYLRLSDPAKGTDVLCMACHRDF